MGAEVMPPDDGAGNADGAKGTLECGFCACKITRRNGEIVRMSPAAKAFRDADDKIEKLTREITERDERIAALDKELSDAIAAARPAETRKKGGGLFSGDEE